MNIAFLGNFVEKKGNQDFIRLVKQYHYLHNFYIFGYVIDEKQYNQIKKYIVKQIAYQEGELKSLFKKYDIDCGITMSVCPESFSRTFFNAVNTNLPVIINNLGFPYQLFGESYPLLYKNEIQLHQLMKTLNSDILQQAQKYYTKEFFADILQKQVRKYNLVDQIL